MLLLLLACQSDNALSGKDDAAGFDTGDTVAEPPTEACNGLDDDGDGEIDEGFLDGDGNGRLDCLDATCPTLDVVAAGDVSLSDACDGRSDPPADPWDIVYESRNLLMPIGTGSFPAVAHLDDDNGDGHLGIGDVPEIAVVNLTTREAVALHGDGSGVAWTWPDANEGANLTIADVDQDGSPDVLVVNNAREVVALDDKGVEKWRSGSYMADIMFYMQTAAADLDGDGDIEVIVDGVMLDGATGAWLATLTRRDAYRTPVLADLDGDGRLEIILGTEVFDADGHLLWDGDLPGGMVFGAVFDADGDGAPEVLMTNADLVTLYAADGTRLRDLPQWTNRLGPPCVADFDGDGGPEIGLANGGELTVIEVDGTPLWTATSEDRSGYAGCSAYDFDQDGAYELLFAGETQFAIYDGRTGATRFVDPDHTSYTLWEYPIVADVDADGAAEIVVVAAAGVNQGVNVYGHRENAWPSPGSTWCSHDFSVTNSPEDCALPPSRTPSWLAGNLFRARPGPAAAAATADLVVGVSDGCVADCVWGPVQLAVYAENQGGVDVGTSVLLEVVALDEDAERVVATTWLPPVPAGRRLDGLTFDLLPEDVGTRGIAVRLDGEAVIPECEEANNRLERSDLACP